MKREIPPAIELASAIFGKVEDPRVDRTKRHSLINVLVLALCGAMAGASGWDELAIYARTHRKWLESMLDMPHGTPSADTFRRVFEAVDPREVEDGIRQWIAAVSSAFAGEVVAIDGKALKAACTKANATTPLHLLHAWAVKQHLLLGQQRVEGAPGEVGAIPELLGRLKIEGAIVTTDANGCTKAVTSAVRAAKADYVLALKGNRGPQHAKVKEIFAAAERRKFRGMLAHRSKSAAHGRGETRVVRAMALPEGLVSEGWCDLKTAVMIDRSRKIDGKTTTERHYYISSLEPDVEKLAHAIRSHWGVENNLHWMLDVVFDEDSRRIRDERSAENYALLTRIALMLFKRCPEKLSVNLKRKKASWAPDYIGQLVARGF